MANALRDAGIEASQIGYLTRTVLLRRLAIKLKRRR